jgi:hypothetical protein
MELEIVDKLLADYDWAGVGADTRHGKIYYIKNNKTDIVYVSSTCDSLDKCFLDHVYYYRSWLKLSRYKKRKYRGLSSYKVFRDGFATIHLIEDFPCDHITELRRREGELCKNFPTSVNKRVAGRTGKQWKAEKKQEKEQAEIAAVQQATVSKSINHNPSIHEIMKDLKAFDF